MSVTTRPIFNPGKDAEPIVQEAGWAPGPVCTDTENLAPTGIRSPDRPTHSQSLYRLRYPAHKKIPMTAAGIEPATIRFVAKQLNHCTTATVENRITR